MDLSPPAILTLRAEAYFAVTTNSVQLGLAGRDGRRPRRGVDQRALRVRRARRLLAALHVHDRPRHRADRPRVRRDAVRRQHPAAPRGPGAVAGPGHAPRSRSCGGPSPSTSARSPGATTTTRRRRRSTRAQLVHDALHHNPGAWQALVPPDADQLVTLLPAPPSETEVTVHPLGLFDVRQHAVPLETVIVRVGANPVPEGQRRVHFGVPLVNGDAGRARSARSPTCSPPATSSISPTTRSCPARASSRCRPGARIRPPGEAAEWARAREAELRYETFVCDDDALRGVTARRRRPTSWSRNSAARRSAAGAAGRSELRAGRSLRHRARSDRARRRRRDHGPRLEGRRWRPPRPSRPRPTPTPPRPAAGRRSPGRPAGGRLMADTLRSLAGAAFYERPTSSRARTPRSRPSRRCSTATCSCRTPASGIAAALTTPFDWAHAVAGDGRDDACRSSTTAAADRRRDDGARLRPGGRHRDRRPPGDPHLPQGRRRTTPRSTTSCRSSSTDPSCRGCSPRPARTRRAARAVDHARRQPSDGTSSGASSAAATPARGSAATSCSRSATPGPGRTPR